MKKYSLVAYGGAFNPPHLDHTGRDGIIGRLLDTLTERVRIIPTGRRDDKEYHGVSDADRLEMLRLSTAEYGDRIEIDDVLLRGEVESTTIAQAEYLRTKYGRDVAQVFGADVAPHMRSWDPTGYVADTLPKIFFARPGYEITGVGNYDALEFDSRGFSSTEVRLEVARILDGDGCVDSLRQRVHTRVLDYILERRLFAF